MVPRYFPTGRHTLRSQGNRLHTILDEISHTPIIAKKYPGIM
jgi:hypothetical protein